MTTVWLEIIIIFVLILLNGFFAMSEIAIISARKPILQQKAKKGVSGAKLALDLAGAPNRFLSSIQIGITTVSVLMGAFGGATIAAYLVEPLSRISSIEPYADSIALAIVVVLISYFTLILGELVPKRLALNRAEDISSAVSRPMNLLSIVATPFIKVLSFSTEGVLFLIGARKSTTPSITQEEITHAIDLGRIAGLVEPDEQKMVTRVFEFGDRQAHSIMTPRTDVIWIDLEDAFEENVKLIMENPFSRFPVIREDPDNIVGVLKARDLLMRISGGKSLNLEKYLHTPLFVPEHMSVLRVLELFRKNPIHLAVVIDEYGGFSGIITPYDLLQAIVGELPVEKVTSVPVIKKDVDGYWLVDGSLPIQEFKVHFDIDEMPEEQRYGTLSGFVMMMLGHVPRVGDHFVWSGYNFQVTEMTDHRVSKLRVHSPNQNGT